MLAIAILGRSKPIISCLEIPLPVTKAFRLAAVLACVTLLASCADPIIEKSRALLLSVEQRLAEVTSLVENNQLEEAYAVLAAAREEVDGLLEAEFNGDRCLFHDIDDGPCPFETDDPYTGKRDDGVAWNMYRANLWLERSLESVRRAESVAAYKAWDHAAYPTGATVARFLIDDRQDPSWQDVVMFNLFVRPLIAEQGSVAAQEICTEVGDIANNEFEREAELEGWRANVSAHTPTGGEEYLFRGIQSVRIAEYAADKGAFESRRELVSRGTWSFEVRGDALVASVTVRNVLARGAAGWSGTRRDCNVSYQSLASAIASQVGEQVSIPEEVSLDIRIADAAELLFQDVVADRETAEALISRYQRIGERMATSDRQVAAMVFYEADPGTVSAEADGDGIRMSMDAAARNVTFYGFSTGDWYNYGGFAGTFGEESLHETEKTPDTVPLMSRNVE